MELGGAWVEVGGVVGGVDRILGRERGEGDVSHLLQVGVGAAMGARCEVGGRGRAREGKSR